MKIRTGIIILYTMDDQMRREFRFGRYSTITDKAVERIIMRMTTDKREQN